MDRMALRLGLACAALVGAAACSSPDPIIMLPDAAPVDSGTDAGGPVDSGGGGCPPETVPAPAAPVCEMSTLTCLMGAATPMDQQACIMADAMPVPCNDCIFQDVYSTCTMMGGCDDEYGTLTCCLMDACPGGDAACLNMAGAAGGACATQAMAFGACVDSGQMMMRCGVTTRCFGAASPFAPDFSARDFVRFSIEQHGFRLYSGQF